VRRLILVGVVGLSTMLLAPPMASTATPGAPQDFETIKYIQQVSRDNLGHRPDAQRDTEVGPHLAVDPSNPLRIVTVFQQSRFGSVGAADNGFATSHDGGQTWVTSPMPNLTVSFGGRWKRAQDPTVAFGPDGRVYAAGAVFTNLFCPGAVVVQRSDDGGLTWRDPVTVQKDNCGTFNDKDWITVDTNPASPFFGRIYLTWYRTMGSDRMAVLKWSDDDGMSWSPMKRVSPSEVAAISPVPLVLPNGDLAVLYSDWFDDILFSRTSHDGGLTFDPPVTVSATLEGADPPDMWTGPSSNRVSASVDPTTGIIYVVWADQRFRTDNRNDAVLTLSADGGATWSPLSRVNQDPPDSKIDHLTPVVAAHGGFVHITFIHRDTTGGLNQEVGQRYVVSADGGVTFGAELELGPLSDLTWSARITSNYLAFRGEYAGLAATDAFAYVAWPHSSRPQEVVRVYHQTMWSATIER
jgi:hypothetical protein